VPKLWTATIDAHRREVRNAVVDTTARLVADHGLLAVTMSRVAEEAGIGRATLYKYFPDVESILLAWHGREIERHLAQLNAVRDRADEPLQRLHDVLEAYADLAHGSHGAHGAELAAVLHRGEHMIHAEDHVRALVGELIADAAAERLVRSDVTADELAPYCLHALHAARSLPSKAAVRRLVQVTLDGLRPAT
jgi:AcrR family transcriptional regulator